MDTRSKLKILADAAKYDASCASSGSRRKRPPGGLGNTEGMGICHSYTPDGRCVSLLKILLTNYCIYDCHYCVNRVSSDTPRARFTPAEVAWLTIEFYKRNYIEGLFLSSGIIKDPDYTMEQLAEVARSLREDHSFGGYVHLKAVPGASPELLEKAGRHADRLSANIELPTEAEVVRLAPAKSHAVIESTMQSMKGLIDAAAADRRAPAYAPAGQTTQMIVGATPATDTQILSKASALYSGRGLRRVYYSAFSPIPHADPVLPAATPPLVREHRLYQADWLYRFYGFRVDELTTTAEPDLDLSLDPKTTWALRNRHFFPVDLNTAPREALLRVPGLGVRTVDRILRARAHRAVTVDDLSRLGAAVRRAKYFVTAGTSGVSRGPGALLDSESLRSLLAPRPVQLPLFGPPVPGRPVTDASGAPDAPAAEASAVTGEL